MDNTKLNGSKPNTSREEVQIIPRQNALRLIRDVKQITKNPLTEHGIYYNHDPNDMLKGYAMIIGPETSLYEDGCYLFEFNFTPNYPFEPPVLKFKTNNGETRFNPNLYKNGKVCISILNTWRGEQWSSCQNISTILLTLVSILNNTPFLNEPGVTEKHPHYDSYHKIIQYENINFSVLYFIKKDCFLRGFEPFYMIYTKHFRKKYDTIKERVEKLKQTEKNETVHVGFYKMTTNINYSNLLKKINAVNLAEYK